jgi:glycosyltransferase involved in cell wall biosynthesis
MGLLFFPRGGSAQVARYLSRALGDAGWAIGLVTGSLGDPGEETHAPTFFGDIPLQCLDYSDAVRVFAAGGSGIGAAVPMHPSYEDRDDVPDVVFSAVSDDLAARLSSVWEAPFRAAGADDADVFHLHHLTPQHDAVARCWPEGAVVAHLHGTEIKFLEAINERAALAQSVGTTLVGMPEWIRANPDGSSELDDVDRELLHTTRWEHWKYGEAWRDRLRGQADAADHLVVVSPADQATAVEVLQADPQRVSNVPNGVDVVEFCPRPMSRQERRAHFRHWLVGDSQGWDETAVAGTVCYRESDLDRLLGPDGTGVVLIFVGRFTSAKRVPLLVRAFARARPRFECPTSLVVWGGHPGEWEGEHPVTVAREVGSEGVFFAGWRGHNDLPDALAASDVFVMPSVNDSYPQSPLEAMAVGLPVIAASSGGLPLAVNVDPTRPTGWLVQPDDEHALAEILVDAANRPDEILRRGHAALAHARTHLSWASRVKSFEEVYARARDHRTSRSSRTASGTDRPNRAR